MAGTPIQQLDSIKCLRQLLANRSSSTFRKVIGAGLLPKFVEFLKQENIELQFEAAWALNNIASEKTRCVVDAGALPVLVNLLSSTWDKVQEIAVCCLAKIARDGPECRDLVLDHGILSPLLE